MDADGNTNHFSSVFNKVQPVRGFEDVLTQIYNAIYSNQLKTGDRLPSERELASMFEVSRTTIREAIRVLEAEQVVEVKRGVNGGISIIEPKPNQLARSLETLLHFRVATFTELAEFRTDFEGKTAFLAAQRATPHETNEITHIAEKFEKLTKDIDTPWERLIDLDVSFHEAVAYASKNQIHIAIMLGIQSVLRKTALSLESGNDQHFRKQQAIELTEIAQAIQNRDSDKAKRIMAEHVEGNITSKMNQNPTD
ncbi:FadR/GntR family transcriptional regulator [Bacillus xiapuensis]|uniref:FadR/GntR family transcriptional regulator n=1 Tax=Bacillus xiapuensis TaxID=2014075 RepID=A0ABU6NBM3_9BACI|nr:FadR/GntR family transcriptional regulator [Bacillus xiapuensis]